MCAGMHVKATAFRNGKRAVRAPACWPAAGVKESILQYLYRNRQWLVPIVLVTMTVMVNRLLSKQSGEGGLPSEIFIGGLILGGLATGIGTWLAQTLSARLVQGAFLVIGLGLLIYHFL